MSSSSTCQCPTCAPSLDSLSEMLCIGMIYRKVSGCHGQQSTTRNAGVVDEAGARKKGGEDAAETVAVGICVLVGTCLLVDTEGFLAAQSAICGYWTWHI